MEDKALTTHLVGHKFLITTEPSFTYTLIFQVDFLDFFDSIIIS